MAFERRSDVVDVMESVRGGKEDGEPDKELPESRRVKVRLMGHDPFRGDGRGRQGGATYINVEHGGLSEALVIQFKRTIRVPDNSKTSGLPPGKGNFPLFNTRDHAAPLPPHLLAGPGGGGGGGGIFFPMYRREAMWLNFTAQMPFALRVFVGGINAVSGKPADMGDLDSQDVDYEDNDDGDDDGNNDDNHDDKKDDDYDHLDDADEHKHGERTAATTTRRIAAACRAGRRAAQDYLVVPTQPWLDGIASEDGRIRQFVAQPRGSGFSVEAQVRGGDDKEVVGGLQIEMVPAWRRVPERLPVRCSYISERGSGQDGFVTVREVDLAAAGIGADSTWIDLRRTLAAEFGVPIEQQALSEHKDPDSSFRHSSPHGYSERYDGGSILHQNARLGDSYFRPGMTLALTQQLSISNNLSRVPSLFSNSASGAPYGGLFGAKSGGSTFGAKSGGSLFGAPSGAAPAGTFGAVSAAPATAASGAPSGGLFGAPPGGSLFGASSKGSTFGAPSGAASAGTFGAVSAAPSTAAFGAPSHGSLFGIQNPNQLPLASPFANKTTPARETDSGPPPPSSQPAEVKEMGVAAGGLIQQTILPDPMAPEAWDVEAAVRLDVRILDVSTAAGAASFRAATGGLDPPPSPVDARAYAAHVFRPYELGEEIEDNKGGVGHERESVKGDFSGVLSVAQMEAQRAAEAAEGGEGWEYVPEPSFPPRPRRFRSTFRHVRVLEEEMALMAIQ